MKCKSLQSGSEAIWWTIGLKRRFLMPHVVNLIDVEQSVPASLISKRPIMESHSTSTLILVFGQTYRLPSTNISQGQRRTYFYPQCWWSVTFFLSSYLFLTAITPTTLQFHPWSVAYAVREPFELVRPTDMTETIRLVCRRIPRIHSKDAPKTLAGMTDRLYAS